jgi:hypothetical protein
MGWGLRALRYALCTMRQAAKALTADRFSLGGTTEPSNPRTIELPYCRRLLAGVLSPLSLFEQAARS